MAALPSYPIRLSVAKSEVLKRLLPNTNKSTFVYVIAFEEAARMSGAFVSSSNFIVPRSKQGAL